MNTPLTVWIIGLLGAAIAFALGHWLGSLRRGARAQAMEAAQGARLAGLEAERSALESRAAAAERSAQSLDARLMDETGRRNAAEATNLQIDGLRDQLLGRDAELARLRVEVRQLAEARQQLSAQLDAQSEALIAQRELLSQAEARLTDTFKSLAAQTLQANNQQFIDLAKVQFESLHAQAAGELTKRELAIQQLVEPVRESLEKVQAKIGEVEKDRLGAYSSLMSQVDVLTKGQTELRRETTNLVGALRRPNVRGRWGELQLKRVVEMAGMLDHVDFYEQESVSTDDGDLRPDMVVRLPGGRSLVVDAKAPLDAYLSSIEESDEVLAKAKLVDHARQLRDHVGKLSRKAYWEQFPNTPDFVVLFIPGEVFYSAALEQDPELIEFGVRQKVILATPTTLIALLRTVSYGWRQEALAEDARRIAELGKELYERLQTMASHWNSVGTNLRRAVSSYNDAVGSMDSRVMSTARKFRDLNVAHGAKDAEELKSVDLIPRETQSEELRRPLSLVPPPAENR